MSALKLIKNDPFIIRMGDIYTLSDFPEHLQDILMACSHVGQCDDDCRYASGFFTVDDFEALRDYLSGVTDWDCSDDQENLERLLWIIAGDIHENQEAFTGN